MKLWTKLKSSPIMSRLSDCSVDVRCFFELILVIQQGSIASLCPGRSLMSHFHLWPLQKRNNKTNVFSSEWTWLTFHKTTPHRNSALMVIPLIHCVVKKKKKCAHIKNRLWARKELFKCASVLRIQNIYCEYLNAATNDFHKWRLHNKMNCEWCETLARTLSHLWFWFIAYQCTNGWPCHRSSFKGRLPYICVVRKTWIFCAIGPFQNLMCMFDPVWLTCYNNKKVLLPKTWHQI